MENFLDDLLSLDDLAMKLGVQRKTVSNWISAGELDGVKIGRRYWVLRETFEKWVRDRELKRMVSFRRRRGDGRL